MRAALIVRKIAGAGMLHGRYRVSYACSVIYDKKKDRGARASSRNVRSSAGMAVIQHLMRKGPWRVCEQRFLYAKLLAHAFCMTAVLQYT